MHFVYFFKNKFINFLQRIWLVTYELSIVCTINAKFESFGISEIDDGIVQGRPYGGWEYSYANLIKNMPNFTSLMIHALLVLHYA